MKSTQGNNKVEVVEFPKLMMSNDLKIIVLFKDSTSGTIVYSNASDVSTHVLGYASLNWCEEEFKDYEGTLTLQN
tara:strand:+ start:293 stop:517 length:225 start_codon:yes stop_codon:yes gene_type:complete